MLAATMAHEVVNTLDNISNDPELSNAKSSITREMASLCSTSTTCDSSRVCSSPKVIESSFVSSPTTPPQNNHLPREIIKDPVNKWNATNEGKAKRRSDLCISVPSRRTDFARSPRPRSVPSVLSNESDNASYLVPSKQLSGRSLFEPASNGTRTTANATLVPMSMDRMPMKPTKSRSDRSLLETVQGYPKDLQSPTLDLRPKIPSRRGSTYDEPGNFSCSSPARKLKPFPDLMSPHTPSSGSSSSATPISASELEKIVLSKIPTNVKNQLSPGSWKRIFTVAAGCQTNSEGSPVSDQGEDGDEASTVSGQNESRPQKRLEETKQRGELHCSRSVVSDITAPTMFHQPESCATSDNEVSLLTESFVNASVVTESTFATYPTNPSDDQSQPSTIQEAMASSACSSDFSSRDTMSTESSGRRSMPPRMPSRCWSPGSVKKESYKEGGRSHSEPFSTGEYPFNYSSDFFSNRRGESILVTSKPENGRKQRGRISFGQVEFRLYERVLEINPSTSSGPSLGLGWRYHDGVSLSLKDADTTSRRSARDLVLPRHCRESILRELGYTERQMAQAVRKSLKVKNQRKQTYNNLSHQKVEYLMEKSRRKVGQLLRLRYPSGR